MEEHRHLPDANRLSVLVSTILLAYAVLPFIDITSQELAFQLPGVFLAFRFSLATMIAFVVAVLAAVGSDWLLRSHPRHNYQNTMQHWLLPALTAWAIGIPLNTLEVGTGWWVVFALGGTLLVLVFVAEYVALDTSDTRYALATVGLTAVGYALYLVLAIAVRAAGLRLYLLLPALVVPMGLFSLRALYLRLGRRWCVGWAAGIALVIGQLAMGLHYLPLSPLGFGLGLLGPVYALTSAVGSLEEGVPWRVLWIEPAAMLGALWGLALLVGG